MEKEKCEGCFDCVWVDSGRNICVPKNILASSDFASTKVMLASGFAYLRHFLAKIRKSEPRMRIMCYLLIEESLFVLDSIPKGCLKIAVGIAKC